MNSLMDYKVKCIKGGLYWVTAWVSWHVNGEVPSSSTFIRRCRSSEMYIPSMVHLCSTLMIASGDPRLHLVRTSIKIFIKPVRHCLLSYHCWLYFLSFSEYMEKPRRYSKGWDHASPGEMLALGFLRSCSWLIWYPSGLEMAKERHLIPANLDWSSWHCFHRTTPA